MVTDIAEIFSHVDPDGIIPDEVRAGFVRALDRYGVSYLPDVYESII